MQVHRGQLCAALMVLQLHGSSTCCTSPHAAVVLTLCRLCSRLPVATASSHATDLLARWVPLACRLPLAAGQLPAGVVTVAVLAGGTLQAALALPALPGPAAGELAAVFSRLCQQQQEATVRQGTAVQQPPSSSKAPPSAAVGQPAAVAQAVWQQTMRPMLTDLCYVLSSSTSSSQRSAACGSEANSSTSSIRADAPDTSATLAVLQHVSRFLAHLGAAPAVQQHLLQHCAALLKGRQPGHAAEGACGHDDQPAQAGTTCRRHVPAEVAAAAAAASAAWAGPGTTAAAAGPAAAGKHDAADTSAAAGDAHAAGCCSKAQQAHPHHHQQQAVPAAGVRLRDVLLGFGAPQEAWYRRWRLRQLQHVDLATAALHALLYGSLLLCKAWQGAGAAAARGPDAAAGKHGTGTGLPGTCPLQHASTALLPGAYATSVTAGAAADAAAGFTPAAHARPAAAGAGAALGAPVEALYISMCLRLGLHLLLALLPAVCGQAAYCRWRDPLVRLIYALHSALNVGTCVLPAFVAYEPSALSHILGSTAIVLWPGLVSALVLQLPAPQAVALAALQLTDHALLFKAAALPAAVYAPKLAAALLLAVLSAAAVEWHSRRCWRLVGSCCGEAHAASVHG